MSAVILIAVVAVVVVIVIVVVVLVVEVEVVLALAMVLLVEVVGVVLVVTVVAAGVVAPLPAGDILEGEGFGPVRPPRSRGTEPFPTQQTGAELDLGSAQGATATAKPAPPSHPVFLAAGGRQQG